MILMDLLKAMKAGEELKDPAKWKKNQETTNLVGLVLAGIFAVIRWKFPEFPLPEGVIDYATEIIVSALVIINLYLTRATTKKAIE